ncbi:hypothetical protein AURDEDRAFT_177782 [Auricularia subglabra TFB-10046 SS5]|uniref:SUN domain-containing protein n=1 Tax=Auricularia subglabra (strain TFB-10046 / SS5) TaxID=717982 RepID=J0D393_AURST|nr:hypothetical protein AURDEDRAFT_177782 [Auricularia subglabra TFB-10046 SS5]
MPPEDRAWLLTILLTFCAFRPRGVGLVDVGVAQVARPGVACRSDHAFWGHGARVVDALTSATFSPPGPSLYTPEARHPIVKHLVRASHGPPSMPEVVLGFSADPRALWFFEGGRGTLGVAFKAPVVIDTIRLKSSSARRCSPRDTVVWGAIDMPSRFHNITAEMFNQPQTPMPSQLMGPMTIKRPRLSLGHSNLAWIPLAELRDIPLGADRSFAIEGVSVELSLPVHIVAVQFLRNWGDRYTCFAALGVYGDLYDRF